MFAEEMHLFVRFIEKMKKPNSTVCKISNVQLENKHDIFVFFVFKVNAINSQDHFKILVRWGRVKDSSKLIRHQSLNKQYNLSIT